MVRWSRKALRVKPVDTGNDSIARYIAKSSTHGFMTHPHFGRDKFYPYVVSYGPTLGEDRVFYYRWLNENTREPWSLDHHQLDDGTNRFWYSFSFKSKDDALIFKLSKIGM